MISLYPMNILLYVLYISDLKGFSEEIWVLIVLLNIQIFSKFCLTSIQDSSGMMTISVVYLVNSQFYK